MKKIITLSVVAVFLIALMGWSTWAFFSDTEASSSNTFSAGTLDLKLTDSQRDRPGRCDRQLQRQQSEAGRLRGAGLGHAEELGLPDRRPRRHQVREHGHGQRLEYNATDLGANIADMSTVLTVSAMSYGATNLLAQSGGVFTNAYIEAADNAGNNDLAITLNELQNVVVQGLTAPAASGGTVAFSITVGIAGSVGNGIQGDQDDVTVTFGLYQDASQHLS